MTSTAGAPESSVGISDNTQRQIDAAYGELDTDIANLAYVIFQIISSVPVDDRGALIKYAVEHDARSVVFDQGLPKFSTKSLKLDPVLTQNDIANFQERLGSLVDAFLDVIFREQWDADGFYEQVASMLENPIFRSDKEKGFAFYWFYVDKRIPYFQLDEGMSMSDDDWRDLGIALRPDTARIRYILATDWISRSSQSDHLLRIFEGRSDVERVRLMAFLVWELESRARNSLAGARV